MVAILLAIIFTMILISLPLWKKQEANGGVSGATNLETATHDSKANNSAQLSFREALRVPGMKLSFFTFFFYSALEISTSLWCGTYLTACGFKPEVGAMGACHSLFRLRSPYGFEHSRPCIRLRKLHQTLFADNLGNPANAFQAI